MLRLDRLITFLLTKYLYETCVTFHNVYSTVFISVKFYINLKL